MAPERRQVLNGVDTCDNCIKNHDYIKGLMKHPKPDIDQP